MVLMSTHLIKESKSLLLEDFGAGFWMWLLALLLLLRCSSLPHVGALSEAAWVCVLGSCLPRLLVFLFEFRLFSCGRLLLLLSSSAAS